MGISVSENSQTNFINLQKIHLAIIPQHFNIPVQIQESNRQVQPQNLIKTKLIQIRPPTNENMRPSPKRESKKVEELQFHIEQIDLNSRIFKQGNEKGKPSLKQSDSRRNMNTVEPLCLSRVSGDVQNQSISSVRTKKVKITR